mgnify:CR=1 FL=1
MNPDTLRYLAVGFIVAVPTAAAFDAFDMTDPAMIGSTIVTTAPVDTAPRMADTGTGGGAAVLSPASPGAVVTQSAERGAQVQVTGTVPPPPRTVPVPAPGDCESWAPVFRWFGASDAEVGFFVPRIIGRESGCGADTLNEATGDSGVCQINPVHNRAGWFGRQEYGAGGWLLALHGLTTRHDTSSPRWPASTPRSRSISRWRG